MPEHPALIVQRVHPQQGFPRRQRDPFQAPGDVVAPDGAPFRLTFERDLTVVVELVPLPVSPPPPAVAAGAGVSTPARPRVTRPPPRPEPVVVRPPARGGNHSIGDRIGTEFE